MSYAAKVFRALYDILRARWLVCIILLVALELRIIPVFTQELSIDEAYSVEAIRYYGFPYDASSPPLYYILLGLWGMISHQIVWLRLLSVVVSFGTLVLFYKLGTLLKDKLFGHIILALLAISSFHIHYSWQARMPVFVMFTGVASLVLLLRMVKDISFSIISRWRWVLFFVVNGVGVALHYGYVFYLASLTLFLLLVIYREQKIELLLRNKTLWLFLGAPIGLLLLLLHSVGFQVIGVIATWIPKVTWQGVLSMVLTLFNATKTIYATSVIFGNSLWGGLAVIVVLIYSEALLWKQRFPLRGFFSLTLFGSILGLVLFQMLFSSSLAVPRYFSYVHSLAILSLGYCVYELEKKKSFSFIDVIVSVNLMYLCVLNVQSNISINYQSFYTRPGYGHDVMKVKRGFIPNERLLILPTYTRPIAAYFLEVEPEDQNLLGFTKDVERTIKTAKTISLDSIWDRQGTLIVLVEPRSIFSTYERSLLEEIRKNCRLSSYSAYVFVCDGRPMDTH